MLYERELRNFFSVSNCAIAYMCSFRLLTKLVTDNDSLHRYGNSQSAYSTFHLIYQTMPSQRDAHILSLPLRVVADPEHHAASLCERHFQRQAPCGVPATSAAAHLSS